MHHNNLIESFIVYNRLSRNTKMIGDVGDDNKLHYFNEIVIVVVN